MNGDFIRASQELETKETTGDYKYEQAVTGSVVQFNQHGLQFLLLWEIHKWEKSFISSPTKSFLYFLQILKYIKYEYECIKCRFYFLELSQS